MSLPTQPSRHSNVPLPGIRELFHRELSSPTQVSQTTPISRLSPYAPHSHGLFMQHAANGQWPSPSLHTSTTRHPQPSHRSKDDSGIDRSHPQSRWGHHSSSRAHRPSSSEGFPPNGNPLPPTSRYASPAPQGHHNSTFAVLEPQGGSLSVAASATTYRGMIQAARVHTTRRNHDFTNELGEPLPIEDSRVCPYCGKVCDRPSTLKTHINSHTGERPHVCYQPGCGRQFTVLSNMYRHAKSCPGGPAPRRD